MDDKAREAARRGYFENLKAKDREKAARKAAKAEAGARRRRAEDALLQILKLSRAGNHAGRSNHIELPNLFRERH